MKQNNGRRTVPLVRTPSGKRGTLRQQVMSVFRGTFLPVMTGTALGIAAPLAAISPFSAGMYVLAAEPEEKAFEINSIGDLALLAENCRINTWSDGLQVELTSDLDFTDVRNVPCVSYFNGTFNGNGHRITNIESQYPLFRTIGPAGRVRDLQISSDINTSRDNAAALVSENNGVLDHIKADCRVSGKVTAAVLAAVNESSGIIRSCETAGYAEGDSSVGGIAGKNLGRIESSVNRADINHTLNDDSLSTDDVKNVLENIVLTGDLNSTENLRMKIDSGGIAGFNSGGTITDCVNEGAVGYPHIGYNTGGIAGRNGGVIERSGNKGIVNGRKDIGGITGHQQPEITLDFSSDVLQSMADEMDGISAAVADTLNTAEGISDSTYDRLMGVSQTLTDVKQSTRVIYDSSLERFDEAAESINTNTGVAIDAANDIADATEELSDSLSSLSRLTDDLDSTLDSMSDALGLTYEEKESIRSLNASLREDLNSTSNFVNEARNDLLPRVPEERQARVSDGLDRANRLYQNARAMRTILGNLKDRRDRIADGSIAVEAVRRDAALSDSISGVLDSMDDIDDLSSGISSFTSSLGGTLHDTASRIDINVKKNDTVRAAGESLYAGLDRLSSQMDNLSAFGRDESQEVIRDLLDINSRFDNLTQLMRNERDRLNSIADDGGVFVDQSDTAPAAARVEACRNEADVFGDMNVGGIAGTIGIEYDVDPDNDILRRNNRSLDYTFGVSAAVISSENMGNVEGRGNYAGGITGRMELGYLKENRSTGDVIAEDGYFIGGIVGYADGTLESNTARCRVSGTKNVGGICGRGTVLKNNVSAVTILTGDEYIGAVAGRVEELDPENISNNIYYIGSFGGIDNIDYAQMAERSEQSLEDVVVKFTVNGRTAGIEETTPGTVLKDLPYPEVPEREGFVVRWDTDPATVLEEDRVVNAGYYLPTAVLTAPEKYAETEKPLVIADGQFVETDELEFREEGAYHYHVVIPEDGLAERKIRVHKPEQKRYRLIVNGTETPYELFGDYLTFRTADRELDILVQEEERPVWISYAVYAGISAAVLLILTAVVKKIKAGAKGKGKQ